MNRHVKAATPLLLKLAQQSKYASISVDSANTYFEKRAHIYNLDSLNQKLVDEAIKLGSAVMQSLQASHAMDKAKREKDKEESGEVKESMSLPKALATGAAIAAVPALAANYTINRASEDLDSKMLAIPGLAAATVGAILAARNMSSSSPAKPVSEEAKELETALNAKQVVDSAVANSSDEDLVEELSKVSSISTDHIASLLVDILL